MYLDDVLLASAVALPGVVCLHVLVDTAEAVEQRAIWALLGLEDDVVAEAAHKVLEQLLREARGAEILARKLRCVHGYSHPRCRQSAFLFLQAPLRLPATVVLRRH